MTEITDIYKVTYQQRAEFRGTLRNERKFEYGDSVFIGSGSGENIMVYPAIIKGMRDDGDLMNPSYIYTVQIPNWIVDEIESNYERARIASFNEIPWYKFLLRYRVYKYNKGELLEQDTSYRELGCDRIFTSIQQAKDSVIKNHNTMKELEANNIERYFKRFDNQFKD